MDTAKKDNVNPSHYTKYKIQPAEFCIQNKLLYAEGCVIKYICRWRDKNGIEDLKKAIRYIEILIENQN